jgi:hypothetical protein
MECDRRKAARLTHQELMILADDLILSWYQHRNVLDQALGRVRQLEVEVALAEAPAPPISQPKAHHFEWARQLLSRHP